jgi:DNA-binding response OmpR family regulator
MRMIDKTIVWIERDIDVIEPVIKPLYDTGITFLKYRNYAEARAHADDLRKCDLILLALELPPGASETAGDYLGLTLLHWLRTELRLSTPVIVLSAAASRKQLEIEALGAIALDKPVLPSKLKAEVWKLLHLP